MMEKQRVFENPVIGDKVTYLKISEETNGRYGKANVELVPGGGNFLHYHKEFAETFTAIEGNLTLQLNKLERILKPGESFTVPPNTLHLFKNKTRGKILFSVEIRPGHTGFENGIKIVYGLARDGMVSKSGAPKKLAHLAVIVAMSDINRPGIFALLEPLFKWLAKRARKKGIEQELIDRYCN